jgi:undecaprenyl-diphosphatase
VARETGKAGMPARWMRRLSVWDARTVAAVREWRCRGNRHDRTARLDRIMQMIARRGSAFFFLEMALLLVVSAVRSGPDARVWMHALAGVTTAVVAGFASKATVDALASSFGRARPFVRFGWEPLVTKDARDPSFPSNHAGGAFALATVLSVFFPEVAFASFAWASVLAFSRLYALLHYPCDLAAGAAVGTMVGLCCVVVVGLAWP